MKKEEKKNYKETRKREKKHETGKKEEKITKHVF